MKRILQITALAFLLILGGSWRNTISAQGNVDISYQTFYDELSPYGEWIDNPEYGYVWVPAGSAGFRPYETNGHWVWSDEYEWIWVSDYSWGWAPFHYGRWFEDPYYGWMWVPGYEWSPAWVCWRDGGDYYGWAPLRPGIDIGFGFSMGSYNPPIDYWCFAPRRYISSSRIYDYCVDRGRNVTIINNTTIINNYNRRNNVFVTGPRRNDAERYAGRINPVRFREASRPGRTEFRNNEVSVYRPRVEQNNNNRRFTPRNFQQYDRNRGQNNEVVRRDRDNNTNQGNGNNLPERRDNNRLERRNDNVPQQQQNNDNRRFDRNNNNNQPANNDREIRRSPFERRNDNMPQQQQNNDNRRFDRGNPSERQQQTERLQQQQNQQRQFERQQQQQNQQRQQQTERLQQQQNQQRQQQQNQQRQFDRQQQQSQPRQFERRQESQPRQFENRGGNNREQRGGNDNNGRGHGRRS